MSDFLFMICFYNYLFTKFRIKCFESDAVSYVFYIANPNAGIIKNSQLIQINDGKVQLMLNLERFLPYLIKMII